MAANMNFINIVPLCRESLSYTVAEIRRQSMEVGVTRVALSLSFHPEGTPARDKIRLYSDAFRTVKQALAETAPEVTLGVLIQSTLGHGWSGPVPLTREPWQRIVNMDGSVSSRMCPLDSDFRSYICDAVASVVREGAAFLLVDDDFGLRRNECFCPKHLAEFNAACGRERSFDETVELIQNRPWNDPDVLTFSRLRGEMIVNFAKEIRAAIDRVDRTVRCAICTPFCGYAFVSDVAHALSNDATEPMIRINNAIYGMTPPLTFYDVVRSTHQVKHQISGVADLLDETDTFPHNYFSESSIFFHAHIVTAILNGLNGCKLWMAERCLPNIGGTQIRYERIFAAHQGLYQKLLNELDGIRWLGTAAPLFRPDWGLHPVLGPSALCMPDWNTQVLGPYGVPIRYAAAGRDGIFALNADILSHLTDAELDDLFHGAVLIDSCAAKILTRRGFADRMGVVADDGDGTYFFTTEAEPGTTATDWLMWDDSAARLTPRSPEVRVLTCFRNGGLTRQSDVEVGPGITLFTNSFGGRVAVTGWSSSMPFFKTFRLQRRKWLLRALDFLNGAPLDMVAAAEHQVLVRHGVRPDGSELVAVLSLGYDPLPDTALHLRRDPVSVRRLTGTGEWADVPFRRDGVLIRLDYPLCFCEPDIYKFIF